MGSSLPLMFKMLEQVNWISASASHPFSILNCNAFMKKEFDYSSVCSTLLRIDCVCAYSSDTFILKIICKYNFTYITSAASALREICRLIFSYLKLKENSFRTILVGWSLSQHKQTSAKLGKCLLTTLSAPVPIPWISFFHEQPNYLRYKYLHFIFHSKGNFTGN